MAYMNQQPMQPPPMPPNGMTWPGMEFGNPQVMPIGMDMSGANFMPLAAEMTEDNCGPTDIIPDNDSPDEAKGRDRRRSRSRDRGSRRRSRSWDRSRRSGPSDNRVRRTRWRDEDSRSGRRDRLGNNNENNGRNIDLTGNINIPDGGDSNQQWNYGMFMPNQIPMPMMGQMGMPVPQMPVSNPIILNSCTLMPPFPGTPKPIYERPSGCCSISVNGLSKHINKDTLREIFSQFGVIRSLKASDENYEIAFCEESSAENAMTLAGYRIKIDDQTDIQYPNSGWLFLKYSQNPDDEEKSKKTRTVSNASKVWGRGRRISEETIPSFSFFNASDISEKLKNEETFISSAKVLVSWLKRSECNKQNVSNFYGMIQSVNSHVRRLIMERSQREEELCEAKERVREAMLKIVQQYEQVDEVLKAASARKVWDRFSKPQRKNFDLWLKLAEIKNNSLHNQMAFFLDACSEYGHLQSDDRCLMDIQLSPRYYCYRKLYTFSNTPQHGRFQAKAELSTLKEEYGSDKAEQEANEDSDSNEEGDGQKDKANLVKLKEENKRLQMEVEAYRNEVAVVKSHAAEEGLRERGNTTSATEAKLIALMSAFLNVHPYGASAVDLHTYIARITSVEGVSQIEGVLENFPNIFQQQKKGRDEVLKKWTFIGFSNDQS